MRDGALVSLFLAIGFAAPASSQSGVRIAIESPAPGARVENRVRRAFVSGSAAALGIEEANFDVVLVLDISQSTSIASGGDIDGDGEVGIDPQIELPPGVFPKRVRSTDPEDTVLHAESEAGRALLNGLDAERVHFGLVTFSGDFHPTTGKRLRTDQSDAWVEVPITADYPRLQSALDGIAARGPRGATNFAAGIRLAVQELAGLPGSQSRPRPDAKKMILFLTDGMPTFPVGRASVQDPGDIEAALLAARLASRAGITINTYAIGPGALSYPEAATEIARRTGGVYTPVRNPGDIVALLRGVSFVDVRDVVLSNLSSGELSTDVRLYPDGTFRGFIPVRDGENRIRATALASDGSSAHAEIEINFGPSRLDDRELALELERIRRENKQLVLEQERRSVEEFRRKTQKEIELEVESGGSD